MNKQADGWPMNGVAEIKKKQFVNLVGQLAGLRDLQYADDSAQGAIDLAQKVVALNLPTNLLRAAAIFVDYIYGFPADRGSFGPPKWVLAKELLPKEARGSLICTGFKDNSDLEETDVVVLVADMPERGLHAGMAGIVRELPSEDGEYSYLVEFGEPDDCLGQKVKVLPALLRRPRPGDLLENYRW
jgi:hypothetical protein